MAANPTRRLRYPFAISLIGGTVAEEPDYDRYIVQLLKQVLLTNKGERVCRPSFGAGIRRQVFAPNNDATAALTRTIIFEALNRWLGSLIRIDGVNVRAENEILWVTVTYYIFALGGDQRVLNEEVSL
jgi:phage baseplate assembly protein W